MSIRKTTILELIGWLKGEGADWRLHPLINTPLKFTLAQNMVSCQRGEKEASTD